MENKYWTLIIIGTVILSLVVGGLVGSQLFPKTKIVEVSPTGKFCYSKDQLLYVANSVKYDPMLSYGFVSSTHCLAENPGKSRCYIDSYNPNYVTSKVSCVCQK